ncbi:MAG: TRAP transporter small permease [Lachnospiraceae bacterium]|nr:TRAP transporter small permease [Lachnospiraceae bacterium]
MGTQGWFQKVDKGITQAVKWISYLSGVCLVGIMLVAFFNVLGEKLRKVGLPVTGIPASTEIIQYLHIPVVFLASAYVTLDAGHTKIDLLSSRLPRPVQDLFTTIGCICGTGVCGFVSWRGFAQMANYMRLHKMSSVTGVGFPLWPFALVLALGFALLAVTFLWSIFRLYLGPKGDRAAGPGGPGAVEVTGGPVSSGAKEAAVSSGAADGEGGEY